MKRLISVLLLILLLCLPGCSGQAQPTQLVCTTLPVYEFTTYLCKGTPITSSQLITQNVSCLHDYTLNPTQMRAIEKADAVILSGGGLEDFLHDALSCAKYVVDASAGIKLHHSHDDHHGHSNDPHIWLSPDNAMHMASNILNELSLLYPQYQTTFAYNHTSLIFDLQKLQAYGDQQLQNLSCRELITFHDGFSYLAEAFNLEIIKSMEEESGSEASAADLIEIITLVQKRNIPVIFTEKNGSTAAAGIIAAETGNKIKSLDMAISGNSYLEAMYQNITTLREALE